MFLKYYIFKKQTGETILSMAKVEKNEKSRIPKVVRLSAIDEYVLTALKAQGESYPLEILDRLNLDSREIIGTEMSFGSLYPALNRLQKKGLVDTRWGDENEVSKGARRKYYKINALGLRSLDSVIKYRANLAKVRI